jgi:NADPH-dependent 2,4-dienoyl-CoA reductase/sulfur reductase-like enzyme/nitrite reductase/ring-hydroxylating ferredoxin subunit
MGEPVPPSGPDLAQGVAFRDVPDGGMLVGQVEGEAVLLVRRGDEVWAVAATCAHWSGPLPEGIVVDCQIRCPWHHAWFDVRTGEAVGPPSPRDLATWEVLRDDERVRIGKKRPAGVSRSGARGPASVVMVGAGGAADYAAATLRREGYTGPITLIGRDDELVPMDRPNLSKDFLSGVAPEDWLPIRDAKYYRDHDIRLVPGVEVTKLDPAAHRVTLGNGQTLEYGAVLLATGAAAIRLDLPGATLPHVFTLRTLQDTRGVLANVTSGGRAVVIGASFIGLEVAASLLQRGMQVSVVAPESRPLERIVGPELGELVRRMHAEHGVRFFLGRKPASISTTDVTLDDGTVLPAQLVVMGVGVRPLTALAEAAGLKVDKGVLVGETMRTSAPDVWAAGDIARFPAPGGTWRIEHWVVAQQQGKVAALDMLGRPEKFRYVPFFWSQHYDLALNYVGHAERWDRLEIAGSIEQRNAIVAFRDGGRITAVVTVFRDRDSLLAAAAFERDDQAALEKLLADVRSAVPA